MKNLRKRMGAFVLAIAMMGSLLVHAAPPAQAAGAGDSTPKTTQETRADRATPTAYVRPKLSMDFLGDNKSTYGGTGAPGSGALPTPAPGNTAWNGYVSGDQSVQGDTGKQTIFWIGIAIDNMDQFILANGGKGIHSLELALAYNPQYVEPYTGNDYTELLRLNNINNNNQGGASRTLWSSDYQIIKAVTGADPAVDPAHDPATQELDYTKTSGWKMTYISLEKMRDTTGPARFSDSSSTDTESKYVMMIPFLLKNYDAQQALCIKLIRNASMFSIGSGIANATGTPDGTGFNSYGNWDKYTYRDPAHDLKLMLDYTGDLNIFTAVAEPDEQTATLTIITGGNAGNKAEMTIKDEPYAPPPSQLADADGETIVNLSGGEELQIKTTCTSGYQVAVSVVDGGNNVISNTVLVDQEHYTFIMPTGTNATVKVTFTGPSTPTTPYSAELEVDSGNYNEPGNNAKLSVPGGSSTPAITTGTTRMSVLANTTLNVVVARNSDYNVAVTAALSDSTGLTVNLVSITDVQLIYAVTMPAADVKVTVKYTLAPKHKATLQVNQAAGLAGNKAKLSYTDGSGVVQSSDEISGANPSPANNFISTREGRVITVETGCDSAYRVKSVRVTQSGGAATVPVTRSTTDASRYTFVMPAYAVNVVVTYEPVPVYKVRLVVKDSQPGDSAMLKGTDARGIHQTTDSTDIIEVFAGTPILITTTRATGRTATVKVTNEATGDVINYTGSLSSGYTFDMVALDDLTKAVVVEVTFSTSAQTEYTASIAQKYLDGAAITANNTVWTNTGGNDPISAQQGDVLNLSIAVERGSYISAVTVETAAGVVPVTLSGIGYHNGQGGSETASFVMPAANATFHITYTKGVPPAEPDFTAHIYAAGAGAGTVSLSKGTASGASVTAQAGDAVTATYTPSAGSYVAGVTVAADVPGTAVSWQYTAAGALTLTMPAANVSVTVTFAAVDPALKYDLTLDKGTDNNPGNVVETTTSGGPARIPIDGTVATATTPTQAGELVVLDVAVAAGFHIASVVLTDGGAAVSAPVTLSGTGYNGGLGGNETAAFAMPTPAAPGTAITATVTFTSGAPATDVALVVDDPTDQTNNVAELFINGVSKGTLTGEANTNLSSVADPGDHIEVRATPAASFSVTQPVGITPGGVGIVPQWTAVDRFEFTMPADPLTVTVPFAQGTATQYRADIILRGDTTGVELTTATFGGYNDLNTPVYAKRAQAGEYLPFAVAVPDGYYISEVSVTPASHGVAATLSGAVGQQQGGFAMPAGDVYLNITIDVGWPDDVEYGVNLKVTDPAGTAETGLKNLNDTATAAVTVTGSGSAYLTAKDGQWVRVSLKPGAASTLDHISVTDHQGNTVPYRWALADGLLGAEFALPASAVQVEVVYQIGTPDQHNVTLHTNAADVPSATASIKNQTTGGTAQSGDDAVVSATAGDTIDITADTGAGTNAISAAFAVTASGTAVALSSDLVGRRGSTTATLTMPYGENVELYINFATLPGVPAGDEHTLGLTVTGPAGSGTVTLHESLSSKSITATALGGDAMYVKKNSVITATVTAQPGYALYGLTAVSSGGTSIPLALKADGSGYTFTMPDDAVKVEAVFRAVAAGEDYQVQLVVNNTVNNGMGANSALLYSTGDSTNGFTIKTGVAAGTVLDLAMVVESGYQVSSVIAVPQGSGVSANIELPLTSSQRAQVSMPAANLVLYIVFGLDTTTRYSVTAQVGYEPPSTRPTTDPDNTLELKSVTSGSIVGANSDHPGMIQAAQGEHITVTWMPAPGYYVFHYTAKTLSGDRVLTQPTADGRGIEFRSPAAAVIVDVIFAKEGTPQEYKATLHYDTATPGGSAELKNVQSGANTAVDGGHVPAKIGEEIRVWATPAVGNYVLSAYVMRGGQMLPLSMVDTSNPTNAGEKSGSFFMPAGDVDVFITFTATAPTPDDHAAVLTVLGPNATSGSAEMKAGSTSTGTVNANDQPKSIVAAAGNTVALEITVAAGYAIDSVTGTPILLAIDPAQNPDDATRYTFSMTPTDQAVMVELKAISTASYNANLYVSHLPGTDSANAGNVTKLANADGDVTVEGDGNKVLSTKATDTLTLTVAPAAPAATTTTEGYYVRAAYAVQNGALIPLSNSLEGVTSNNVAANPATNAATFTMPVGAVDIYVVYEFGVLPQTQWYNLVVVATDSGGATANTGTNKVRVSSDTVLTTAADVLSNGTAVTFMSLPAGEKVVINAQNTGNIANYVYDTMSLSALVTPPPTLTPVAGNVLGDVQAFTMGAGNTAVAVNFKSTGVTGLNATLRIVDNSGASASTVELSVGTGTDKRAVYNDGDVLTELATSQIITAEVDLSSPADVEVFRVLITKEGAGTTIANSSSATRYTSAMEDKDVTVTVILEKKNVADLFVATVQMSGDPANGAVINADNTVTGITNTTTGGLSRGDIWTEVKASDQAMVSFTAQTGTYVTLTAVRRDNGAALPVAQFGVGNGSAGTAYVQVPAPGTDVLIFAAFSKTPPADVNLTFISKDHGGVVANDSALYAKVADGSWDTTALAERTPTLNNTADVTGNAITLTPGDLLQLRTEADPEYHVEKVSFAVTTAAGSITVVKQANAAGLLDFPMPLGNTEMIVLYKPGGKGPRPYDPENNGNAGTVDGADARGEGYLSAVNLGDSAIVTVPTRFQSGTPGTISSLPTSGVLRIYYEDGTNPSVQVGFLQWDDRDATNAPAPVLSPSATDVLEIDPDGVTWDEYYTASGTPPTVYNGVRFTLRLVETADPAAQSLWDAVQAILDNDGSGSAAAASQLTMTLTEWDATKTVWNGESDVTQLYVPQYYTLTGELISYAPTHEAELSLYPMDDSLTPPDYAAEPSLTATVVEEEGVGLWQQTFMLKSSALVEDLATGTDYKLVIEKPGHVTYERTSIVLEQNTVEADHLTFIIKDAITLIAGDLDRNSAVKMRDRDILVEYISRNLDWSEDVDDTGADWDNSIFNPASYPYRADLNGDGNISTSDLAILMDARNFGMDFTDYGTPTGLDFTITTLDLPLEDVAAEELPAEPPVEDPAPQPPEEPIPPEESPVNPEPPVTPEPPDDLPPEPPVNPAPPTEPPPEQPTEPPENPLPPAPPESPQEPPGEPESGGAVDEKVDNVLPPETETLETVS